MWWVAVHNYQQKRANGTEVSTIIIKVCSKGAVLKGANRITERRWAMVMVRKYNIVLYGPKTCLQPIKGKKKYNTF